MTIICFPSAVNSTGFPLSKLTSPALLSCLRINLDVDGGQPSLEAIELKLRFWNDASLPENLSLFFGKHYI